MYLIVRERIIDIQTLYQWRRHYVRVNKFQVCPTLTANMGPCSHNVPIVKESSENSYRQNAFWWDNRAIFRMNWSISIYIVRPEMWSRHQ